VVEIAWYKVDDQLHSHPKARRAGLEAMGLWTLAGSHCMSYLTDGFVEAWFVESWPHGTDLAKVLVREGLWREAEGGWRFHDWGVYQPTRHEIESKREARAEAGRKGGLRSGESRRGANGEASASAIANDSAKQKRTPSPSPSPRQLLTESVSLGSNARATSTDAEAIASSKRLAEARGLDLEQIINAANRIDRLLTHGEALQLGSLILEKAKREPGKPTAYVLGAFKRSPFEVQQWIDTEVIR